MKVAKNKIRPPKKIKSDSPRRTLRTRVSRTSVADKQSALSKSKYGTAGVITSAIEQQIKLEFSEGDINHLQNLNALGSFMGGIAHDFNNALTSIMHNVYAAKMFLENEAKRGEVSKLLDSCMKTIRRSTDLTHKLLMFSSEGEPIKKRVYLKNIIKDAVESSLNGSNVGSAVHIPDDLWPTSADEVQMERAIGNLVSNAKQAMSDGGIVNVRAENVVLGDDDVLPLRKGKYVKISIKDTSSGIRIKYLQAVFDPDSKTSLRGSSRLADTYLAVRKHGGHIDAESEAGVGVTFHVYLPASDEDNVHRFQGRGSVKNGKVLVMDGERDITDSMQAALSLMVYESEFVRGGEGAIRAYRRAKRILE